MSRVKEYVKKMDEEFGVSTLSRQQVVNIPFDRELMNMAKLQRGRKE